MVKVQQTLIITLVHIRQLKTKPGGEWTWEKWNLLLKCTLSTETRSEADCQILKSELVGYYLLHHLLVHSYTPIHVNVQDQCSIVIATTNSKKIKGNLQVYAWFHFNKVQIVGLWFDHLTTVYIYIYQLEVDESTINCV